VRDEDAWPGISAAVRESLLHYRSFGCTTSFNGWRRGVNAIGVPVVAGPHRPVAAINCGGPVSVMSQTYLMSSVRPRLLELVAKLVTLLR